MSVTRLVTLDDAVVMAELLSANRDFLAQWEPQRDDDYFTAAGQRTLIEGALARHSRGTCVPHVIVGGSGQVVGRITLNGITRGVHQSCDMGCWVGGAYNGRGYGTTATRDMIRVAFDELRLHRIQTETMLDNVRSQAVLERLGFARIGVAQAYMKIAGKWRDHVLYQRVNEDLE